MSKLKKTTRVTFDILIFLAICCATYAVYKWFVPFKRGFFCGDESLQYPYHNSFISIRTLFFIVPAVPSLVILAVELFKRVPYSGAAAAAGAKIDSYRLGYRLRNCYAQIGIYLFGFVLTIFAGEISKSSVGRLRPHFFAVCQPQLLDGSTCDDAVNFGRYIEEYTCSSQNYSRTLIADVVKSFPSGHASTLFYSMLYTSIYIQASLSTRASKLLKHVLQFIFMLFAWYVVLTRISENNHHWSDVAGGILLGCIMAVFVALFVANVIGDCETRRKVTYVKASRHASSSPSTAVQLTTSATSVLPAYTYGTLSYQQHPYASHSHQYGAQTYHNYGYAP